MPLELSAKDIDLAPLQLVSTGPARLRAEGRFQFENSHGQGALQWEQLSLAPLQHWLPLDNLTGQSDGTLRVQLAGEGASWFHAEIAAAGSLHKDKLQLDMSPSRWVADWDADGLDSELDLQLGEKGVVQVHLTSSEAFRLGLPAQADYRMDVHQFPLEGLHPWLPPTLNLAGQLNLAAAGDWSADRGVQMQGQAEATQGQVLWLEDEGTISAELSAARLDWRWRQDWLEGTLALALSEQGEVDGQFRLPLASRIPVRLLPGDLQGELSARLQELGLLALVFPGVVQESQGELNLDLQLAGSWQQPEWTGKLHLFGAGAFLPAAGIQLEQVELLARFDEQQVTIADLRMHSGAGQLTGTGQLRMERWRPDRYQLQLAGENFQLIQLPNLQAQVNPEIELEGDLRRIRVRGRLLIPELLITGKQKSGLPSNSPDLVILDAEEPPAPSFRLRHDVDLRLQLGERVLLKTAGIDAKLAGQLRLRSNERQELAAVGQIRVEKGRYASYGVNLEIERGHLDFTGGPPDEPNLDILALRKAGEVRAGVRVTGTPQQPQVDLYSQPSMPEADILAYIVLGRPLDGNSEQTGLLMTAAGALLSQGESVMLQENLKQRLGLDVLDISAGDGDVASSVITTGKYLSPDLYVSLGYSLFTNSNEIRLRYNITPAWEIQSNFGVDSGVDMYYRIEIE